MKIKLLTLLLAATTLRVNAQFFEQLTPPGSGGYYELKSNNLGELFIAVSTGLFKSTDNGNTWDSTGLKGFVGALEINMQNNDLFAGSSFGVKYSNDNGATWTQTAQTESTSNIFLINSQDLILTAWNRIDKMNYKGTQVANTFFANQWTDVRDLLEHPAGFLMVGLVPHLFPEFIALRSFDNGETWINTGMTEGGMWSLAINSLGDIFSGQIRQNTLGLYKSFDLGLTWEYILEDRNIHKIFITPDDDIYLGCSYQIGPFGGVMHSNDGGSTWENLLSGGYVIESFSTSKDWFLFCGGYHGLYRSTQPIWDSTYRVRMAIEPEGAGTVTGFGTFFHGTTASLTAIPNSNYRFDKWVVNRQEQTSDSLIDLQMIRPMYVTAKFKQISGIEGVLDSGLKFFPNPASNHITVENLQHGYNEIVFYDVAGMIKFAQVVFDSSKITLPISNMPSGIYMVAVSTKGERIVRKMVKN